MIKRICSFILVTIVLSCMCLLVCIACNGCSKDAEVKRIVFESPMEVVVDDVDSDSDLIKEDN